jgi:hypothetical protein
LDLTRQDDLEEAVENYLFHLEGGGYLSWEAVIREEQDLSLSDAHEEALDELVSFNDEDDDVLYINERPRPRRPWYETLRELAPHLLFEPLNTARSYYEVVTEGWPNLVKALEENGQHLSLPEGTHDALEVLPQDLRHRLWLQSCLEVLLGTGGVR